MWVFEWSFPMRENCFTKFMKIVEYEKSKLLHCENEFLAKYRKLMIFVQIEMFIDSRI